MLSEKIEKYVIERTEAFKKELNEEVKQMIKEANQGQVKSVWDLKKEDSEKYYCIDSDGAIVQHMFDESFDEVNRDMGNAFLTREEAELERERRKIEAVMRKYSQPFTPGFGDWYICYNYGSGDIYFDYIYNVDYGIPYFESREVAQKVVDKIGKDRLKKYWFGVKE